MPDDALVMREETFGPVAPVVGFCLDRGADRARERHQLRPGRLHLQPATSAQALQLAERLEFGGIGINVNDVCELQAPFGGWKHSGVGRELGSEGLLAYLEAKHIRMRLPPLV